MSDEHFCYNGLLQSLGTAGILPDNRALRYGDGVFETMHYKSGQVLFFPLHMERLYSGLSLLGFHVSSIPDVEELGRSVRSLCGANKLQDAVVRINVFRGNGGMRALCSAPVGYIIETFALPDSTEDIKLGICHEAVKTAGKYSAIKSNNFLPYTIAALHSECNDYYDCLVVNQFNRPIESTIGNIFCIKGGIAYTPPLSEGCIAGIARKLLLKAFPEICEQIIEKDFLLAADEIFLTNVVRGVRPVATFENKQYSSKVTNTFRDWWRTEIDKYQNQ